MDPALALRVALLCLLGCSGWGLPTPDNPDGLRSIVNVLLSLADMTKGKERQDASSRPNSDRWSAQQKKGVESFIRFGRAGPRTVVPSLPDPVESDPEPEGPRWPSSWRIVWPPQTWKDPSERSANDTFIRFGRILTSGQASEQPTSSQTMSRDSRASKSATDFLRFG